MDNSNDPNSPNNQNPASPFGAPAQPLPDLNGLPSATPTSPAVEPTSLPSAQQTPPLTQPDVWPAPSQPDPVPLPSNTPTPPSAWPSFDSTQTPAVPQLNTDTILQDQPDTGSPFQAPTPTEPAWPVQPEPVQTEAQPIPTFTPPPVTAEPSQQPEPPLSPLDNPMAAPANPPAIDGSQSVQPSWMNIPGNPTEGQSSPPAHSDAAPTDLSHLISNNSPTGSAQPASETLVIPSAADAQNPEVPAMPAEGHKGMPKWLIGAGAGLLILVVGASAYFILGIGQPPKATTSIPATTKNAEIKPPLPITTPVAQSATPLPAASGSANFGELGGSNGGNNQATSAADLIRQRQQQER